MEKKVLLNLNGYKIPVILCEAKKMARTTHYSYGQIYLSCPLSTPILKIEYMLKKMYKPTLLAKFSSDYLYDEDYCYILGEKRRIIRPFSYLEPKNDDLIVRNDEELKEKLRKLSYDIIVSRVRRYEVIMNTYKHDVKITNMYAARGKNYYRKKLLTFADELVHFSIELIDAIVIHELAHDFVQNHSAKFYEVVYAYCSDYDLKIKKLSFGVKK